MLSDDLKALQGFVIPESYLSGNTNKDAGIIYQPYIQGIFTRTGIEDLMKLYDGLI